MTTRETLSPSWRESENLPFELDAGAAGGSAVRAVALDGSGGGSGAGLDSGTVCFTCGSTVSGAAARGSGSGGGTASAVGTAFGAMVPVVATGLRRSTTRRYGPYSG